MITKNEISSLNMSPTKKDFVQIWNELIEIASKITERWDPTSTNESDPGIVLLKVLAGIADKLNYNIDKNILEAFMPTAAQMESMQKLCELVGYDIKYYQSAETTVRITYTGEDPISFLPIPKFTTITNADKDVTFVTTNSLPVYLTESTPWVEVHCIEGQISQCESSNENNLITLAQLDDENKYYLPETQIAENGIFVYNAATSITASNDAVLADGTAWLHVSNLNVQAPGARVFKFGYDSFEGRPYIAFPDDIGSLIGDGLFIYFVRTSGVNGNISYNTLETLELPTGDEWSKYSAEQFEVTNYNAATNGANIESISTAYNNFKKTVGTFDTLVTCRDYMNKIYSLMDADNSPLVSNILVTDIRNDINNAITLCSYNEYGILYKELPLTDDNGEALIDHFDLLLYPFKTFTQVSSGTQNLANPFNESFTYTEQRNREISAALADLKTCAHNFTSPDEGDLVAINNYLRLNAFIATSTRVSDAEAKDILKNVKVALVNEFNLRNLDFGEEIPFDSILSVIENADARIKVVSLQEPALLTTYSVKELVRDGAVSTVTSKEYGIASADGSKVSNKKVSYGEILDKKTDTYVDKAKDIYNKLVLRNILAGRASLFDYDETFIANNSEKPYTITKDITEILTDNTKLTDTELTTDEKASITTDINNAINTVRGTALSKAQDAFQTILDDNNKDIGHIESYVYDFMLSDAEGAVLTGFYNGAVTALVTVTLEKGESDLINNSTENNFKVYETYVYDFVKAQTTGEAEPEEAVAFSRTRAAAPTTTFASANTSSSNGIIKNISKIKALCEIESNTNVFNNITLKANEVIKFRAPNLITTQTFPAYVYYRYEKGSNTGGDDTSTTAGRPAVVKPLSDFIAESYSTNPVENFFTNFWKRDPVKAKHDSTKPDSYTFKVIFNATGPQVDRSSGLGDIFQSAIAVGTDITSAITLVFTEDGKLRDFLNCYDDDSTVTIENLKSFLKGYLGYDLNSIILSNLASKGMLTFKYYPLNNGTMPVWSQYIRECYHTKNGSYLPGTTALWRLSSNTSHVPGWLVNEAGQRLYAQSGDFLADQAVGLVTYICTDLGKDPKYHTMKEKSEVQLGEGDKLYIHYTPSSTNEDGETVNAEPISKVFTGSNKNPIILKPSGFTLMPSEEAKLSQNISWKKTGVKFPGHGERDLLALAPNEQIEMRSLAQVVLDKPARFYKNFNNFELENGIATEYELKDGEYIFYTNLEAQNAAYYGSGSVISTKGGAYIPKASTLKEVSDILNQGLHIIPWSNMVALDDKKTITVTEYQYVTLVEGDTVNRLVLDSANKINDTWESCSSASYSFSGSESTESLPTIELDPSVGTGWEVCSLLELSTTPAHAQTLRAAKIYTENNGDLGEEPAEKLSITSVTNKIEIYQDDGVSESDNPIIIAPVVTENPTLGIEEPVKDASGNPLKDEHDNIIYPTIYAPVSIKLDTIAKTASGAFVPDADESEEDVELSTSATTVQMKVFTETQPEILELTSLDDVITPISNVTTLQVEASSANINNYWTKLDPSVSLYRDIAQDGDTIKLPRAINLNFMIPEDSANQQLFGVFSIYFNTAAPLIAGSGIPEEGYRVFIDVPTEFGPYTEVISIYNCRDAEGNDSWWPSGIDTTPPNRLYLRAGLNCIKVLKSCNLLIKAETNVSGNILYDNLRLVKGLDTQGINLRLLDPDAMGAQALEALSTEAKEELAIKILDNIAKLDKDHEFYYNVPIENSMAMEFDNNNITSFSSPYALYDINNINNNFVVSKLDVAYLETGLRIAKSSRTQGVYKYD